MENDNSKNFRLELRQEDVLYYSTQFSADNYYTYTRNNIDLRPIISSMINRFQKALSKKQDFSDGHDNENNNEFFVKYVKDRVYVNDYYNPESKTVEINNKTYYGVMFTLSFYIDDNTIISRDFFVYQFNPYSRWMYGVYEEFMGVVEEIKEYIKKADVNYIWENYDLINKKGMTMDSIINLSQRDRNRIVFNLYR